MAREYTRDASEYGQQLIADAIDRLAQGGINNGGNSSFSLNDLAVNINITQNQPEKQFISLRESSIYPHLVDQNGQNWWNEHEDDKPEGGKIVVFMEVYLTAESRDNNYESGNIVIDVVRGSCFPASPDSTDDYGGTYVVSLGSILNVTATDPVPITTGGGGDSTQK